VSDLLDYILGGGFIGTCDECHQAKTFCTERERELWERNHPHQEDPA
jgi:hypothetical protein